METGAVLLACDSGIETVVWRVCGVSMETVACGTGTVMAVGVVPERCQL